MEGGSLFIAIVLSGDVSVKVRQDEHESRSRLPCELLFFFSFFFLVFFLFFLRFLLFLSANNSRF